MIEKRLFINFIYHFGGLIFYFILVYHFNSIQRENFVVDFPFIKVYKFTILKLEDINKIILYIKIKKIIFLLF